MLQHCVDMLLVFLERARVNQDVIQVNQHKLTQHVTDDGLIIPAVFLHGLLLWRAEVIQSATGECSPREELNRTIIRLVGWKRQSLLFAENWG